jgi:rhodanese-related sulfurtransferase
MMSQQLLQFATQHWALCAVFIILLVLVLLNEFWSQKNSPKMLSTAAVVELINQDKATIIDIRPQETFESGHITNAIRISGEDKQKLSTYKNKPIVLVCMKGITANTLALNLKKEGFSNTMVLNGGMTAWLAAGLPTIKGKK